MSVGELMNIAGKLGLDVRSPEKVSFSLLAPVVEALHSVSGVILCGGQHKKSRPSRNSKSGSAYGLNCIHLLMRTSILPVSMPSIL